MPPESSNQMRGLKLKRPTRVTVSNMGDGGSGGSHGNSEGGAGEPVTKLPRVGLHFVFVYGTCVCVWHM